MPQTLTARAIDKSTYVIVATFRDEDDALVTPNSGLNWTLTKLDGTVINSRNAVSITPGTSVTIVLSGADLDYDDGRERVLTIQGTYDSDLGSNLPLKDQVRFTVQDLIAVS